jgi:hypothetical protein
MDASRSFQAIKEFLSMLHSAKGELGSVRLKALHWEPSENARDVGTKKKVITAGSACGSSGTCRYDGVLRIGEIIEFVITSPRSGFVHLYDLGTSGTVLRLGPSQEYPDNRVEKDVEFTIPSARICPLPAGQTWQVTGPTTAATGEPERLLVLVTQEDGAIAIEDLHPGLTGRDLYTRSAKGLPGVRGFAAKPKVDIPGLFRLAPDQYDFGLIELQVA